MGEYEYFTEEDLAELLGNFFPDDEECLEHGNECGKE